MVKVGDAFKIDVPMNHKWEVKDFWVSEVYKHHAVLTDGIINVSYQHWNLEHEKQPIKGCWN